MVNSIETTSTKSLLLSHKAVSLKKKVQEDGKAMAHPFKKLKQSTSTASTCSHSSTTCLPSDDETNDNSDKSNSNSDSDGGSCVPEVELTPQEELGIVRGPPPEYLFLLSPFHLWSISPFLLLIMFVPIW